MSKLPSSSPPSPSDGGGGFAAARHASPPCRRCIAGVATGNRGCRQPCWGGRLTLRAARLCASGVMRLRCEVDPPTRPHARGCLHAGATSEACGAVTMLQLWDPLQLEHGTPKRNALLLKARAEATQMRGAHGRLARSQAEALCKNLLSTSRGKETF